MDRTASRAASIDLLLTDVLMPGGGGPALYHALRSARPGLKVLFMSGYSGDAAAVRDTLAGHLLLQKPFDGGVLAAKVREALDAPAGMA